MPRRRSVSSNSRSSSRERELRRRSAKHRRRSRSPRPHRSARRSRSRSVSRSRYDSRSRRRRSVSRRSNRRSVSRPRRSRSGSRERRRGPRTVRSATSRRRSRSSSSSVESRRSVPVVLKKKFNLDDTDSKVEKAIKAAEAAGLTMTKLPTYEYKEVEVKEDMPTIHDRNLLNELNNDNFVPKSFTSSRTKKFTENIVIDLSSDTVKVPEVEIKEEDSLLKQEELPSEEELREMWVKKLYLYRRKMLKGEI